MEGNTEPIVNGEIGVDGVRGRLVLCSCDCGSYSNATTKMPDNPHDPTTVVAVTIGGCVANADEAFRATYASDVGLCSNSESALWSEK